MRLAAFALLVAVLAPAQTGPEEALWAGLRKGLSAENGEEYFTANLKDSALPYLNGTVANATVNEGVSRLVLNMAQASQPEVTLVVHHLGWRIALGPKPGTRVRFSGVGQDFTRQPFMLTFSVERKQLEGVEFEQENQRR
jgi:hypothetical protein